MAVKPGGKDITIKEQIIDLGTVTLLFEAFEDDDTDSSRLIITGDAIPFGNLEIFFGREGGFSGSGTALQSACTPSWLKAVPASE